MLRHSSDGVFLGHPTNLLVHVACMLQSKWKWLEWKLQRQSDSSQVSEWLYCSFPKNSDLSLGWNFRSLEDNQKVYRSEKRAHETSWNSANARFSNFRVSVFFFQISLSEAVCFQMLKGKRKARKARKAISSHFNSGRVPVLRGDVNLFSRSWSHSPWWCDSLKFSWQTLFSGSILNAKERRLDKWHRM